MLDMKDYKTSLKLAGSSGSTLDVSIDLTPSKNKLPKRDENNVMSVFSVRDEPAIGGPSFLFADNFTFRSR